jgi:hypothetical protein
MTLFFWVLAPCRLVGKCQRFGLMFCLCVSPKRWHLPTSLHGAETQKNNINFFPYFILSLSFCFSVILSAHYFSLSFCRFVFLSFLLFSLCLHSLFLCFYLISFNLKILHTLRFSLITETGNILFIYVLWY